MIAHVASHMQLEPRCRWREDKLEAPCPPRSGGRADWTITTFRKLVVNHRDDRQTTDLIVE